LIYCKIRPYLVDSIIFHGLKKPIVENNPTGSSLYHALNWLKLGCPLFGGHSTFWGSLQAVHFLGVIPNFRLNQKA